jgi:PAS domain S-box-containing protein
VRSAFVRARFREDTCAGHSWMTRNLLDGFWALLAGLMMCVYPGLLHADAPRRAIGQFVHTGWSAKDGAPGNVQALAQTADGFLWLGTAQGLYRFDGVSFERYEPFQSSNVQALLALPNGDLWIALGNKGVSHLHNGRITSYDDSNGLPSKGVWNLAEDHEGAIWAGTLNGLARFDHDRWQPIGVDWGYLNGPPTALFVDRHGTLWVASPIEIVFLPPGSRKFQATGVKIGQTYQIVESPRGAIWAAETTRSVHPLVVAPNQHSVEPEIKVGSIGILFDDDGSLWITSLGDGMRRVPFPDRLNGEKIGESSGDIESFTARDGLTSDYLTCILRDREGSIWVGSSVGLDQFRRGALVPILLPAKSTYKTLVAGNDGKILVGNLSPEAVQVEGNTWKNFPLNRAILSGFRDPHGVIWLLDTSKGPADAPVYRVWRMEKGKLNTVAAMPDVSHSYQAVLAEDRTGTLWLGTGADLFFSKEGRWKRFETPPEVIGKRVQVAFTGADGRVWFGFSDNTLLVMDGTNVRIFTSKDGLQVGAIGVISDCDGHVWIGGGDGLEIEQGNHFRSVLPADSEAFHRVSGIQEDSTGDVFLSELRGVVNISAAEVAKILKDPSARVQYRTYDVRDGIPGTVQQGFPYPTAVRGTDGRIWFATSTGVAWIDPAHIPENPHSPPVAIRSITANGIRYTSQADLRLPPTTRDLTVDYTALSLAVPERVRFRYKLEGSDRQWQDAGTRREAFYTNLSPGDYVFRVSACNNDGVWNVAGVSLSFNIAPAWYQTIWFRALCVLAFFTLLWGAYQMRVHQLQEQEEKFREAVETMPALAFVAEPGGNRTFLNRGWLDYTGLTSEQTSGSGWQKAVHPDDLERVAERWRTSEAGESLDYEARLRRGSDGTYRWFQTRARPLRDSRGRIVKWCAVSNDIEDRKQAEQLRADLTHASRVSTMGELVASISHELAQPITVTTAHARASLRWLQRDPPELAEVRKGTERIVEASSLASEIISRLRSLYKKSSPKRELISINEIVGEMIRMMGDEAGTHGISIQTDLKDDLPMVAADRVQVQQVLMNLMLNGIEAMKDTGGTLRVNSQLCDGGEIEISVNDTGPGLSANVVDLMFDAFFTTKPQGSGMGLAISKSIVESHGGRIWANSDGGRGATFHFTLPASPA